MVVGYFSACGSVIYRVVVWCGVVWCGIRRIDGLRNECDGIGAAKWMVVSASSPDLEGVQL